MVLNLLHPDDLLFFGEVKAAMFRVAKSYSLPLRSVTPLPMPTTSMADRLGDCNGGGDIRLVMRCTVDGAWCEAPMSPAEIWDTAAHELAHLRHMNHGAAFRDLMLEMAQALTNQQEDHREKMISKLVKMQAARQSEAEIGNDKAAEAFAAAINRMLIEYELNPSDIDYARTRDNDPIVEIRCDLDKYGIARKKKRVAWQESLARIVAKAHLCQFLISAGRNTVWFVGTKSHATVAEYVYGILVPAADRMAQLEHWRYAAQCDRAGHASKANGFRAAWLAAFVLRVAERLEEMKAAAVKEAEALRPTVPGGESTALVRLNGALVKVQTYIDDKFKSKKSSIGSLAARHSDNSAGRAAGRAAADRMPIGRRGVAGGSARGLLKA